MALHQPMGLPKLAGRLTAELILRAPQEMNAVKEYQIDLRGNKIAAIENLGATQNQFTCVDLSDNEIVKAEGFPKLTRLETLLLNNNRISRIAENLGGVLPNLEVLVLTNNRLASLSDIDNIASFPRLKTLSLLGNSVTKKPEYRLYAIYKLRGLKQLDFQKVKTKEREAAVAKYGPYEVEQSTEGEPPAKKAKTFEPGETPAAAVAEPAAEAQPAAAKAAGPTAEQLTAIKIAIANAQTLEEVARLEKALKTGVMPDDEPQIDLMDEG